MTTPKPEPVRVAMTEEQNWRIWCAEAVGWEKYRPNIDPIRPTKTIYPKWYLAGDANAFTIDDLPDPLHSIADAFALVGAARKDGKQVHIVGHPDGWIVVLGRRVNTDPDLCRAITIAFLKLRGRL